MTEDGFFGRGENSIRPTGEYTPPASRAEAAPAAPAAFAPPPPTAVAPAPAAPFADQQTSVPPAVPSFSQPIPEAAPEQAAAEIPAFNEPTFDEPAGAPSPTDPNALSAIPSFSALFGNKGASPAPAAFAPAASADPVPEPGAAEPAPTAEQIFNATPPDVREAAGFAPEASFDQLQPEQQQELETLADEISAAQSQPAAPEPTDPLGKAIAALDSSAIGAANGKTRIQAVGIKTMLERAASGNPQDAELLYKQGFGKFEDLASGLNGEALNKVVSCVEELTKADIITPVNVYAEIRAQAAELQTQAQLSAAKGLITGQEQETAPPAPEAPLPFPEQEPEPALTAPDVATTPAEFELDISQQPEQEAPSFAEHDAPQAASEQASHDQPSYEVPEPELNPEYEQPQRHYAQEATQAPAAEYREALEQPSMPYSPPVSQQAGAAYDQSHAERVAASRADGPMFSRA